MSLSILHVWDYEYPWDVRIEKVSRALSEAGHAVHLTARNRHRKVTREEMEEATVHRMSPTPWLGRRLEAAAMFPAFLNPRWVRLVRQTALRESVDLILVRDIPLGPLALWVGRQLGVPVVLDMAENYGAMMRDLWDTGATGVADHLVRNPRIVDGVERWCLDRLDHVVVVVEESAERLQSIGYPADRLTVASNTPPLSRLEAGGRVSETIVARQPGDPLVVVYLGIMEIARGVGEVIQAVDVARQSGADVRLELIGDGRAMADFRGLVADRGLDSVVNFHGFVEYSKATELLKAAHVGVIPHHVKESWDSTIPNKLFDYMAAGIPIVASNAKPVDRVVHEVGCGYIFRDRDVSDLAQKFVEASRAPDLAGMARRGIEAIRTKYNWGEDAGRLVRTIEAVARQGRRTD